MDIMLINDSIFDYDFLCRSIQVGNADLHSSEGLMEEDWNGIDEILLLTLYEERIRREVTRIGVGSMYDPCEAGSEPKSLNSRCIRERVHKTMKIKNEP